MNPDGSIVAAPANPIFALVAYLVVTFALLVVFASSRTPAQRAIRLLFLYLSYGTTEIALKRLTHFVWYVYPIKFVLFAIAVAAWWSARPSMRVHRVKPPLLPVVSMYMALAAIQIFNPNQANPLVGVVGWMTDFMYVALYFVAFDLLRDERETQRLFWLTAALGVLSAVSCFAEMSIGAEELQRQYPTFVALLAYTPDGGVLYRPSSLVPYIEIFGIAAMVALIAARGWRSAFLAVGIGMCVLASLFHAVRIAWITGILFLGLFTLLDRRKSWVGAAVVVASVAFAMAQFDLAGGVLGPSFESLTTPVQTFQTNRMGGLTSMPRIVSEYPIGLGVGEGSPGLRFIDNGRGPTRPGTHNYLTDLAGELSLIGPVLLLVFGFGIGRLGWRTLRGREAPDARRVMLRASLALFGALLISFFGGGGLAAYPANEYFWLLAGVIARFSVASVDLRLAVPRNRMLQRVPPRGDIAKGAAPARRAAR